MSGATNCLLCCFLSFTLIPSHPVLILEQGAPWSTSMPRVAGPSITVSPPPKLGLHWCFRSQKPCGEGMLCMPNPALGRFQSGGRQVSEDWDILSLDWLLFAYEQSKLQMALLPCFPTPVHCSTPIPLQPPFHDGSGGPKTALLSENQGASLPLSSCPRSATPRSFAPPPNTQ